MRGQVAIEPQSSRRNLLWNRRRVFAGAPATQWSGTHGRGTLHPPTPPAPRVSCLSSQHVLERACSVLVSGHPEPGPDTGSKQRQTMPERAWPERWCVGTAPSTRPRQPRERSRESCRERGLRASAHGYACCKQVWYSTRCLCLRMGCVLGPICPRDAARTNIALWSLGLWSGNRRGVWSQAAPVRRRRV